MIRSRFFAFVAGIVLVIVFSLPSFADSTATLSVIPVSSTVAVNNTVTLDVSVSGVTDLYGFGFDLSFDPGIVSANSVAEGSFLPLGGSTYFIAGTIDNVGGTITGNGDVLLSAVPGVDGDGTLAILTLEGLAAGTTGIDLSNVILLDSGLNSINTTIQNASLTVAPTPVPEPSILVLLGTGLLVLVGLAVRKIAS
jgi:adhesin HecA-like repeat protein